MKRNTLCTAILLASLPLTVAAQSGLHEVVITASPLHTDPDMMAQAITSLSGEELRRRVGTNLGETLEYHPGISNASFGPSVGMPVIRGQSGNRVKVLENQLDTLDASNTSNDHAISIEPLLADRIEVLRGPATLRYGSGAIGGVINVIDNRIPTEVPEQIAGAVELRHNSVSDGDTAVFRVDGGQSSLAWHLDGLYRDSNNVRIPGWAMEHPEDEADNTRGFIDNTQSRSRSGTAGLSWVSDKGHLGFSINNLKHRYGVPAGAHIHHDDHDDHDDDHDHDLFHDDDEGHALLHDHDSVHIDLRQTRYTLHGGYEFNGAWLDTLDVRLAYNDYQHIEFEGHERGTVFTNKGYELRSELTHQEIGHWHGALGAQLGLRDYSAVGHEAFIPASDIYNYGLFWIEELDLEQLILQLGARVEYQSIEPRRAPQLRDRSHSPFSLSSSLRWRLDEEHSLSLLASRSQRAPTVEELFSDGEHLATASFDLGDDRLKVETSHNVELGYHYRGGLNFDVRVFYNEIEDFIFRANTGMEDDHAHLPVYQYRQERARFHGAEVEFGIPLTEHLAFNLFADTVRGRLTKSGDVPRLPPSRVGAALTQRWGAIDSELRIIHATDQDRPGAFEEETDDYTRVDLSLGYRVQLDGNELLLFLKGRNLIDREIRNATSFLREVAPEPGRSVEAGLRYSF